MNEYIAAVADELYELGVRAAVISPGSRSTPLAMLFCEHKFKVYMNIDERSAAFFALGIAKEECRPVVLICTSGSAAVHYLPAVTEARYSRVPLIILTADRPPELQGVGAPQTIDQDYIFGNFVKHYEQLAIPERDSFFIYPRIVMRKAYMQANAVPRGAVHINVPLREPLVPELKQENFAKGRSPIPFQNISQKVRAELKEYGFGQRKGMIVCGGDWDSQYQEKVVKLGNRLKAPVLADPLSNLRNLDYEIIIDAYDAFLNNEPIKADLGPDYILLFGQPPVSKRLFQFLSLHKKAACYQIDGAVSYRNPALTTTHYLQMDAEVFIDSVADQKEDCTYLEKWQNYQEKARARLQTALYEEELFEGKVVQVLQRLLPQNCQLCVANSMAIRDIDYFWKRQKQAVKIFCSRGTNGIDGTVSTALGVASGGKPTVLMTGDLAFFHDLNGLLIGKTHQLNLTVILLNNDGGGIFQYLPQKGSKYFEYLFTTSHGMDFQGLETIYGLSYHKINNYTDLEEQFQCAIKKAGISILEVKTNMEKSWRLHERYTHL